MFPRVTLVLVFLCWRLITPFVLCMSVRLSLSRATTTTTQNARPTKRTTEQAASALLNLDQDRFIIEGR